MTLRMSHLLASATLLVAGSALAAPGDIFVENFDDGNAATRWTVGTSGTGGDSDLAFDYSTIGLASPTGAGTTIGANFNPNLTGGSGSVGAVANGLNVTGDYSARFYYASSFLAGDGGSTEATYAGINADPGSFTAPLFNPEASDGVAYHFVTDQFGGGGIGSVGRYDAGNVLRLYDNYGADDPDDGDPDLVNFPAGWDFTGPPQDVWQLVEIVSVGNEVKLYVNSKLLDTFDNSAGETAGSIFIGAMDTFGSVGNHFHVFDDLEVTTDIVPEPATAALLGLGALAMLRRRGA